MSTKTSAKRLKYIEFRVAGNSVIDSARFAGYSDPRTDGYRLEKHPEVVEALQQAEEETRKKNMYSREQAVADLLEAIGLAKQNKDPMGVARCVQELNKMHGFHAPQKREVVHTDSTARVVKQLETTGDEQLLEKLGGPSGLTIEGEYEVIKDDKNGEQTAESDG